MYAITLAMRMCTQNVATPTIMLHVNFHEENFRDQNSNHEIHENSVPRKFGAIRYVIWNREVSLVWRSNKYVSMAKHLGTSMAVRITEVSLIQRPVIERFHCGRHV